VAEPIGVAHKVKTDWAGRRVLVAGGLGFLGGALVTRLVGMGAQVRVLDSLLPHFGGSPTNIRSVAERVEVLVEDTRNRDAVNRAVRDVDTVFHLAGAAGPDTGAGDFYFEIDVACLGTWHLLAAVRCFAPSARFVLGSSHLVYSPDCAAPVGEESHTGPDTIFGAHQLAAEAYSGVYGRAHELDVVIARLTTVFGPRQRLHNAAFGSLARVFDSALHGEDLRIPGDGRQHADFLYVDDAVDALLALGQAPGARGLAVNVGSGQSTTALAAGEAVIAAVGRGRIRPLVDGREESEPTGRAFVPDLARLRSLGVSAPIRSFEDAVRETAAWYLGRPT